MFPETDPEDAGGGGKNTEGSGGGGTPAPTSSGGGDATASTLTLTPAELQARINDAAGRVRDEERKKYDKKLADERATEERKKAEEQGEFKRLYEAEKAEKERLVAQATAAAEHAKQLNGYIDEEVKGWDQSIKDTDPGPDSLEARLKWRESHRALALRLKSLGQAPDAEHGAGSGGESSGKELAQKFAQNAYRRPASK